MLRGELHADQGNIDFPARWRMAYVAQETRRWTVRPSNTPSTATPTCASWKPNWPRRSAPGRQARRQPIAELHTALADADAYTVRSRAEQLLLGLGFRWNRWRSRWPASPAAGACA
jgi:ATP-binding cassette subfamily F protein 3